MNIFDETIAKCNNVLPGHGPRRSMKEIFQVLADGLQGDEYSDRYGEESMSLGLRQRLRSCLERKSLFSCHLERWHSRSLSGSGARNAIILQ